MTMPSPLPPVNPNCKNPSCNAAIALGDQLAYFAYVVRTHAALTDSILCQKCCTANSCEPDSPWPPPPPPAKLTAEDHMKALLGAREERAKAAMAAREEALKNVPPSPRPAQTHGLPAPVAPPPADPAKPA